MPAELTSVWKAFVVRMEIIAFVALLIMFPSALIAEVASGNL